MKTFRFTAPVEAVLGSGVLNRIGESVRLYGKRALILTGAQSLTQGGHLSTIEKALDESGVQYEIWSGIQSNPTTEDVENIVSAVSNDHCDVIVGIGGGSVIDTAKMVSIRLIHAGQIWDYIIDGEKGTDGISPSTLPIVAVPTTTGTGTEVTPAAVVTNTVTRVKAVVVSSYIYPRCALVDPILMTSQPWNLTAQCGMDALVQAIEAYTSKFANPITDAIALEAIRLVGDSFRKSLLKGENLEVRLQMALAAFMSGIAMQSGVGAIHALAAPLSGRYEMHHGLAVALLAPSIMHLNASYVPDKYVEVARALGKTTQGMMIEDASELSAKAVEEMLEFAKIQAPLRKLGVTADDIETLCKDARNPDMAGNPRELSDAEIMQLYRDLL
ncbi:MAG: iron-containing alcohol dehydrogenase [Chloroflexota bacterium]|nr:iron-containing alcohol dehydrogenase [Chloroflexota bacterium]